MSVAIHETIETFLENPGSVIARDLKLNFTKLAENSSLSREEAALSLLAAATAVEHRRLAAYAIDRLQSSGMGADEIREAQESASLVGMLNVYYRFRHFMGNPEEFRAAGLRMTALARPALGKERFEMLAFTVSVLNGCETCVRAHEKALRDSAVPQEKIHDLARLAAVVKGLKTLIADAG